MTGRRVIGFDLGDETSRPAMTLMRADGDTLMVEDAAVGEAEVQAFRDRHRLDERKVRTTHRGLIVLGPVSPGGTGS